MKIYDILPEGQKNAVPRRDLIAITGLSDRTLRSRIAAERRAGALILSCTDNGGGYFRAEPGNAEELRRYIRSMTRRGCETFAVLSAAKAALEEMEGAAGGGGTGGGE